MSREIIHILCATDDAYVPICGIMLTSLFISNPQNDLHVFILVDSLKNENEKLFFKLAESYHQTIEIIHIDQSKFKDCPIRDYDHVSLATYYRLLAPILLPTAIDKVIYLDCDMLIVRDIASLWNYDVSAYAVAACCDEDFTSEEKYIRLAYPPACRYVNAGMLVMNLKYWRGHSIVEACFSYISGNAEKLCLHDQDTINYVLRDRKLLLPPRYNLQTGYLYKKYMFDCYPESFRESVWAALGSPVIIHYSGSAKPWKSCCSAHPYSRYFEKYKKLSFWKDEPGPQAGIYYYVSRFYHHLQYGLGLAQPLERFIITKQIPAGM